MPMFQDVRQRLAEDPRLRRLLHGALSSVMGRGMAMLVGLISLPLTVRYLGKLEYGIWVTVSTTVSMLAALDLGIANTLTNRISEAFAAGDNDAAETAYATAFWLTAAVVAALAVASFAVWRAVDFGRLFHLTDAHLIYETRTALLISLLFFLVTMPLNLAHRVLGGYQKVHISNYWIMGNSVLGLGGVLLGMALHGSLVLMMFCYCVALIVGSVALNLWTFSAHRPALRPRPSRVRPEVARGLFRQGSMFFLLQLTGLVVFNTDNVVIAHYVGADQVTPYSVAWRLTSYVGFIQQMLVPSMWPAFSEAYSKRQMDWVRRIYRTLSVRTAQLTAVAALGIGLGGRLVLRWWAGPAAVPSQTILWTMAAWAVLVCMTTNQALLLTSTNRLRVETAAGVAAAIANLALSVFLVQRIGPEGVILATVLSFLVLMLGPQQVEVGRVLSGRYLPPEPTADPMASFAATGREASLAAQQLALAGEEPAAVAGTTLL